MKLSREDRRAVNTLNPQQRGAFETIAKAVANVGITDINNVSGVCRALQAKASYFYLFTCLGTYTSREELKLDIRETSLLSSRRFRRARDLLAEVAEHVPVQVKLILPDAEPRRVWGWSIDQDEVTTACELMIEQALEESLLPNNWQVVTWTSIEATAPTNAPALEQAITWATEPGQLLHVKAEAALMARHSYITTRDETLEIGRRLAAHLAYESAVLATLGDNGILLHVDGEGTRREKLLAGFCPPGIPVIHGIDIR